MRQALGAPAYVPRSAGNVLRSIVEDHLDELEETYDHRFARTYGPLSPRVIDLFRRFCRCGDAHFGFLRLRCQECKHERLLPFSCKARGLCPSCGKRRAIAWAERMVEEVLPEVPYTPLVFTIPKIIRPAFLYDRRLYGDFCRAAYRVVREHLAARFPHLDRPIPAFLASPQSFGNLLNFHPHLHTLVSAGVFDGEGHFHEDLDIDFTELEYPFRDALLEVLEKRGKIDQDRIDLIKSWPHSGFRVHAERIIAAGAKSELESILQYMERPPVSLKRITYLDTGMVHYQGRHHPGLGRDHQLVTGLEFLAMLVPHIQLRYESKIRLYGALSTTMRKRWGWIEEPSPEPPAPDPERVAALIEEEWDSEFIKKRRRGWAHLIRKVWLHDPELCEKCGGRMKVVSAISSPAQDDLIEATLKARGEWSPPWLGRGPPAAAASPVPVPGADSHVEYELDPDEIWADG